MKLEVRRAAFALCHNTMARVIKEAYRFGALQMEFPES